MPAFSSFLSFHRKPLLILSIALSAKGGRSTTIVKWTNMEVSTNWTNTFLPALVSRSAFHSERWSAILWIIGWICAMVSLCRERGIPRYLQGKSYIWHGRCIWIISLSSCWHWMGKTLLFCMLVLKPEASPKRSRISRVIPISTAEDLNKKHHIIDI